MGMLGASIPLSAQYVYHDASVFPVWGKATPETSDRYARLPDSLELVSRAPLWNLSRNSAGLSVRFRSGSTAIAVRWELLFDNHMNHMTDTGVKGLDLYCLEGEEWRFVNSARPRGKKNQTVIISSMEPQEREYMLCLPLYDGILSLEIGVDSLATLDLPAIEWPRRHKPVVFYGTSILQGGCASRPGMAHTHILSRWFNREMINLGFSGNGQLDREIAPVIAGVDASVFVLDFVPNATVEQMEERMEDFYRVIREKHPSTPILFVEGPVFTHTRYDRRIAEEVNRKNETLRRIFAALREQGEKHIYLLPSERMIGTDGEATVDGIHFTDVGFMRYAELLREVLSPRLSDDEAGDSKTGESMIY
ncbi:MAG: SGNH/GDSL hydrolase family protein [Bacteroides sp.]|nr:SGNH/GDSL hydrolase family protein [Bacteroides sp.]